MSLHALLWVTFGSDISADRSGLVMATVHTTFGHLSHSWIHHIFSECPLCARNHALLLDNIATLLFINSNIDFLVSPFYSDAFDCIQHQLQRWFCQVYCVNIENPEQEGNTIWKGTGWSFHKSFGTFMWNSSVSVVSITWTEMLHWLCTLTLRRKSTHVVEK